MNRFTFTSLKFTIFAVFLAVVGVVLLALFLNPCYQNAASDDSTVDIPAVVYISDADASGSDISASDISATDIG